MNSITNCHRQTANGKAMIVNTSDYNTFNTPDCIGGQATIVNTSDRRRKNSDKARRRPGNV